MDEQNAPVSAASSNRTIPIIVAVVVLLGAGWYFTRGVSMPYGVNVDKNTVGAQSYPDNWPSDAPKYTNGQVQYSISSNRETDANDPVEVSMVILMTSDTPQIVSDFYKKEFPANGWKIEQITTIPKMTVLSAKKGTLTFRVQIASGDNNQTTVTAILENL